VAGNAPAVAGFERPEWTAQAPWQSDVNITFDDNPETARVAAAQQLLFPANSRAVCEQMGLNWWAALKLHEDGWLSFSPASTPRLDEAQEAELRFVGSLVIAGCDRGMLAILLDGLPKPYAYDAARLYYDWAARRWRLLPDPHAHPEAVFTDWLEALVENGDVNSLTGILELGQDALSRVRGEAAQPEFDRQA
jgi:hypothetical protein